MYKCDHCEYTDSKYFGLCPKCQNGMGQKIEQQTPKVNSGMFKVETREKFTGELNIQRVNKDAPEIEEKFKTQFNSLNDVLSSASGFVDSQIVLIGANPGTGKSTLMSQISDENTLYISSEESYNQINSRMLRVNPNSKAQLMSTTNIEAALEAISTTDAKLIVIDSINSFEFGSWQASAKDANDVTKLCKDLGKMCVIISQVTKGGELSGSQSIVHVVDTVLYMERSEISDAIILSSTKNRFSEVGQVAMFHHTQEGLVEISPDTETTDAEIGITYAKSRFGHKNLTIAVESLVTDAQGQYGMKKSNGFNYNILIQLTGILAANSSVNLNYKDVYVQFGNGLSTNDVSLQLAIMNSILSSYHNKAIVEFAYGSVKLNGRVNDGYIISNGNNIKINHIQDLIKMYKE